MESAGLICCVYADNYLCFSQMMRLDIEEFIYAGIDGQEDMKLIYGIKGLGTQHKGRRESKFIWVSTNMT